MSRRTLTVLAVTALFASGCGSSGSGKSGSTKTSASAYVKGICTSVSTWVHTVESRSSSLQGALGPGATPAKGKAVLKTYIGQIVNDTDVALRGIQAAGTPDVTNGAHIAATLVGAFQRAKGVLTTAQTQANNLPTGDPSAFQVAANKLGTTAQQSLSSIGTSLSALGAPALTKAAEAVPACKTLGSA